MKKIISYNLSICELNGNIKGKDSDKTLQKLS